MPANVDKEATSGFEPLQDSAGLRASPAEIAQYRRGRPADNLSYFYRPSREHTMPVACADCFTVSDDLFLYDGHFICEPCIARITGWVYLIRGQRSNALKIGYSRHPEERVLTLQASASEPLELLAKFPGTTEIERRLHGVFSRYRLHGEWFREIPEILLAFGIEPA